MQSVLCSSIWHIWSLNSVPNKVVKTVTGNSKHEALKRKSLLNTFAYGGLNIVDIRTKIESLFVKNVLQLIKSITPGGPS